MAATCKVCERPDDWDVGMVACDHCGQWFHFQCVGVSTEIKDNPWSCQACSDETPPPPISVSSRRSKASSVFTLGLQMLEDDLLAKQKELDQERALEEMKLALKEKYMRKQQALQEDHQKKRQAFLLSQGGAVGGSTRDSVIELRSQHNVRSKVELWMEKIPNSEETRQKSVHKPTGCSDPRGAYPKAHPLKVSSVTEHTSTNNLKLPSGFRSDPVAPNHLETRRNNVLNPSGSLLDITAALSLHDDDDFTRSVFKLHEEKHPTLINPIIPMASGRIKLRVEDNQPGNNVGDGESVSTSENIDDRVSMSAIMGSGTARSGHVISGTVQSDRIQNGEQINVIPTIGRMSGGSVVRPSNVHDSLHPASYGLGQQNLTTSQLAARQVLPRKLPTFSGRSEEWPLFYSSYNTTSEECGYSMSENLVRLQECLKGPALELVRSRLVLPQAVPQIVATLKRMYGRPEQLLHILLEKVRKAEPVKLDRLESFVHFGILIEQMCDHLEATHLEDHLVNPLLLKELVDKLPANTKMEWVRYKRSYQRYTLRTFSNFMAEKATDASEATVYSQPKDLSYTKPEKKPKEKGFVHSHDSSVNSRNDVTATGTARKPTPVERPCHVCQKVDHRVRNCPKFKAMTWEERTKEVNKLKLCSTCLNEHGQSRCRFKIQCNISQCQERHHPLMHPTDIVLADNKEVASSHYTHSGEQQPVIFRMLHVTLYFEDRSVDAVAFLDEGSSLSLVEAGLTEHLGVKGVKQMLRLIWTANISRTEKNSKRVNLQISAKGCTEKWPLRNAHTVTEMKLPVQSIRYSELAQKFEHLKDFAQVDDLSGMPRILIGLDNIHLFAPIESRIGNPGEPIAVRSKLGWAVYGPNSNEKHHKAFIGHHVGECINNQELHDLLREHFSVEDAGVTASTVLESDDDRRAKAILESTTVRTGDRFETGLLWKSDEHHFPNSFPMVLKRLKQLEKRLSSNVELADAYHHQISEYLRKGYAHIASPEELAQADPGQIWYLPVSIVTNPKKPGKVRLVWDASAKVSGISLNSLLLKGPDLLASLVGVISQFRERRIGFGGDIMEMYHQMLVRPLDRLAQCFLYRRNPEEAPEIYVMDRCTFGSACSPCSAQFVKNRNAEEHAERYPNAAAAIIHKHYVDDYFDSTNTVQEAVKRALEVKTIHTATGFHIRNWMSNSVEFLTQLGEAKPKQTAYFSHDKHAATERVLGIAWRPEEDVFIFPMTFKDELKPYTEGDARPTKRTALKCLMSLFDPLGLVAPFVVHGKILLQEIWRTGSQWDDEISDECFHLWTRWIQLFPKIASLRIPRPYFSNMLLADNETVELHVFVDGSLQAYGCAVYLRVMDGSTPRISLAMAKSKVGPIKQLSVPRMELQAAVLGARMVNVVESNHSLAIKRRFLWTDSQAVLSWINSDQRKFKQFVSFRIVEILSLTNAEDWRKIPSRLNIADDLTKWGRHFTPDADDEWFRGPKFLYLPEQDWPQEKNTMVVIAEELRASILFHEIRLEEPVIDTSRISRWNVLVRTVGMVYRFISNCRRKCQKLPIEAVPTEPKVHKWIVDSVPSVENPLQQDEYRNAENCLWRAAQCDTFGDEITILKKNKQLPLQNKMQLEKSSQLYKLSPFLDDYNVLRMRGRTEEAEFLPYDVRFPVILPKNHAITLKLIEHYHKRFGHSNNETVVNEMRQRFVIFNLRAGVRNVARNCQWCRVHKCHPAAPIMAPLPVQRLIPFLAPFSFVGFDYCGPLEVTIGRRTEKRWIAVFTCFTVRAVHLEVSYNLTTQSCLMAIRRFMSRRGAPLEIFTDNGTNLHGASKEMCTLIRQIDEECAEAVTNARLKWRFNPPSAPHMGGVWERMVRSVKQALRALDDGRKLTDEILQTALVEAEEMINSRPLTYQPQGTEDAEALSPNHFLRIGPSNGQLVEAETELATALRDTYRRSQYLADQMWKRWLNEYLPSLNRRSKWHEERIPVKPGDIVYITDESSRKKWIRGIVEDVTVAKDGRVRQATVRTKSGVYKRPVTKLAVVEVPAATSGSKTGTEVVPEPDVRAGDC